MKKSQLIKPSKYAIYCGLHFLAYVLSFIKSFKEYIFNVFRCFYVTTHLWILVLASCHQNENKTTLCNTSNDI